jgi:non-ribosomal peptide synthetase-like protein
LLYNKGILTKKSIINGEDQPGFIGEITLGDLFENTCQHYPHKTALIFNNTAVSYQSLDEKSNAVANFLFSKGIGPGKTMGVWLNRGLDLHICILGIIKSGAAYIPFDKEMPAGRVLAVLTEIKADGCFIEPQEKKSTTNLVTNPLLPGVTTFFPYLTFAEGSLITGKNYQSPSANNIAYIIYTSGSTGQPKGIPIRHKQICHFVKAENSILGIRSTDRVYQGFSVSFDMWLEETWISYLVGATLVISDVITSKSFDSLHHFLNKHKITVLHAVPSLLALLSKGIPTLRLINSGGEACTQNVQKKWCQDVELYNSYGPTETTVSASISRLALQDAITIGIPLPNYGMAIIDEMMNPLELGEKGELVISGPGLSTGYINREDLTAQKFIPIPPALKELRGDRIYLTGDAGSMDEMGRIHLSGRKDDQVKLRGYRIELGEIEATLNKLNGISQSVVTLKQLNGVESLVAYTIRGDNGYPEEEEIGENVLKKQIAQSLPAYMIPSRIIFLKEFPRLASGKVNKKLLPDFPGMEKTTVNDNSAPSGYGETIAEKMNFILQRLFPDEDVMMEKDFFDDLGGHSLLAALFVSELRENAAVEDVSIKDVYINRPLSQLLSYWESSSALTTTDVREGLESKKVSDLTYYTCWFAQSIALVFIYALLAAQIFVPYLGYYYLQQKWNTHLVPILVALLLFCLIPIVQTVVSLTFKWLVIGKMKEGDYPLWGSYYFRWWFSRRIVELVPLELISGTPLFNKFLSLLGATVAKDAQLSNFRSGAEDLLYIGENVTISSNTVLNNAYVERGFLKLRKIEILANGYLGTGSVVNGNCRIECWGELNDLSALGANEIIKEANVWEGSPAKLVRVKSPEETVTQNKIGNFTIRKYKLVFTSLFLVFPFAVLLPLIPTILTLNYLDDNAEDYNFSYLIYTPILAIAYLAIFLAIVVILSRWLQHKVRPGRFPVYSLFYVKKWLADQLLALSLTVLHPIYASVYVAYFFRLLGAKVGKNTEISTASNVTHKLFEIGNESFIADAVILGESDIRNHEIILDHTSVGNKTFVGNSSLIPQGYQLGDNMLIAVLSVPPTTEQQHTVSTRDWLGSPAIALPKRQESLCYPASLTFAPPFLRKLSRGFIEMIRIVLPETAILCLSILFIAYGHDLLTEYSILEIILLFPLYYLGIVAIPAFLITVVLKWIVVGKYKEEQLPMWTLKVWLSEGITSVYEALSVPFFLDYLRGTPWLPLLLRLYGVKTGSKVWLDTTDITEFDMVVIGSNTAINREAGPQTHLFEDRIMKIGPVFIGEGCSIGTRSIILYNTHIGNDTEIEPLSLVMKGESLPANTRWTGSPVRSVTKQQRNEDIESCEKSKSIIESYADSPSLV